MISPEMATDPGFVKRLERDAALTGGFEHNDTARVHGIEEAEDGGPYIAAE